LHQLPRVRHPTAVRELGKHAEQCAELLRHGAVGRDLSGRDDHRGGDELQLSRRRAPRRAGPAPRALACLRTGRAPRGDGTMADTADVVVVGGGVNGASIAWALASRGGKRVVLCETGALASGASGRSSALVRMHYTNETDAPLAFAGSPPFRAWTQPMGGVPPWIRPSESRVIVVQASAGLIDAGAVVVAAGAWAPRLCREIGLELPARVKGIDTVVVTRPAELTKPHVIFIDNVQGSYFRPESGILTIVGVPCQDWDLDPDGPLSLPPEAPSVGAQILTHRIPTMERATLARGYRAFDCYSRDRHAILGRVDGMDGLYLATAFSGSGFKIAPAVGMCMAELVLDGRAKTVDIEPFGLGRFAEGRSPEGPYPYAPRRDHAEPAR